MRAAASRLSRADALLGSWNVTCALPRISLAVTKILSRGIPAASKQSSIVLTIPLRIGI